MPWVQLHARALSLLLVLGLCAPRSGRGTAKNEPVGETLSRGARHQRFARVGRVAPAARRTMPDAAEGPLLEKAAPAMRCKPSVHCAMGMAKPKVVCPTLCTTLVVLPRNRDESVNSALTRYTSNRKGTTKSAFRFFLQ